MTKIEFISLLFHLDIGDYGRIEVLVELSSHCRA